MNILENGLDSFKKSVLLMKNLSGSKGNKEYEFLLKDIIIGLHHSTETLFKFLVSKKDDNLIYKDLRSHFEHRLNLKLSFKSKYKPKTIDFIDVINRVIILYDLEIEPSNYSKLKFLNEIRNSITHYEFEFEEDITEHTVAMLIPTLFRIYIDKIPSFKNYAEENNLYSDIQESVVENLMWDIKQLLYISTKINRAKSEIEKLDEEPDRKKAILENRNKKIEYKNCIYCGKNSFKVVGSLLIDTENAVELGKCDYCKLEVDKKISQYLYVNYGSLFNIETWIRMELSKVLKEFLKIKDIDITFGKDVISIQNLYKKYTDLFEKRTKIIVGYFIEDMISRLLKNNFESSYYFENDTMENIIENDDSKLLIDFKSLLEDNSDDERLIEDSELLGIIVKNYSKITGNSEEDSFYKLVRVEYVEAYENGMYMSWNGVQIESEISIRTDFNAYELWSLLYCEDDEL
ncbi:MAG: hypothetical protein N4A68_03205 [Maledivibacter sp.]|jgi:hypothetical protein|nr:hypothetical protein [Maledivibacter sp.]